MQELVDKYERLPKDIRWHMIGHLQRNKVKYIVDKVVIHIQPVYGIRLYDRIFFVVVQNSDLLEIGISFVDVVDAFQGTRLTNSMVTFCSDRFIDIELLLEDEKGLKIPNSAIVEKEFLVSLSALTFSRIL